MQLTTWDGTTWIARRRSPPDSGLRFWTGRISKRDRLRRDIFQSVIIEREVPRKALASCPVPAKRPTPTIPRGYSAAASWTLLRRSNQPLPACGPAPQTTPNGPEATAPALAPYGYRVNGNGRTLHPYEPEQRIIMLMQDCAAAGYSQRAIENDLNRAGFTTALGNLDAISTFASAFDTQHHYRQPRQQGRETL